MHRLRLDSLPKDLMGPAGSPRLVWLASQWQGCRDQQRDGGLRGKRASSSLTPASYHGQWPETLGGEC